MHFLNIIYALVHCDCTVTCSIFSMDGQIIWKCGASHLDRTKCNEKRLTCTWFHESGERGTSPGSYLDLHRWWPLNREKKKKVSLDSHMGFF